MPESPIPIPQSNWSDRDRQHYCRDLSEAFNVTQLTKLGAVTEDPFDTLDEAFTFALTQMAKGRQGVRLWSINCDTGALHYVALQPELASLIPTHVNLSGDQVETDVFKVRTFAEASAAVSNFISRHNLGAGCSSAFPSFTGGQVFSGNILIGRISYNGRAWDLNEAEIALAPAG